MWKRIPWPPFPWISVVRRVFLLCSLRQEQPPFPERKRRQKPRPCQVPPASEELVPKPWPSFAWSVCPKHIICGSLITVWSAFVGPLGVFSIMTVKKQRIVSSCGGPSRKGKMPTGISAHATKCVHMSVCAHVCVYVHTHTHHWSFLSVFFASTLVFNQSLTGMSGQWALNPSVSLAPHTGITDINPSAQFLHRSWGSEPRSWCLHGRCFAGWTIISPVPCLESGCDRRSMCLALSWTATVCSVFHSF